MAPRPKPARAATRTLLGLLPLLPGCAWAPRSRVDEAHRLVQSLRAENAQIKDASLNLRTQNQELAQRAVDDARAIKALEQANQQYEQSIIGYQDEREAMRTAFRDVERQARAGGGVDAPRSAENLPADAAEPLEALARARPGGSFDPATGTITVDPATLFAPGARRLSAEGSRWVDDVAVQVAANGPDRVAVRLASPSPAGDGVRPASLRNDPAIQGLDASRTQAVRQAIAARAGVAADRVRVAVAGPASP